MKSNTSIEEVLRNEAIAVAIFSHLPYSFRFAAAVSQQFRGIYSTVHDSSVTSYENAVSTIETARIWLAEGASVTMVSETAASFGRVAVLEDLHASGLLGEWGGSMIPRLAATNGHLECYPMGVGKWLSLEYRRVPSGCEKWSFGSAKVGACE